MPIISEEWQDFQKEFDNHLGFESQTSLKNALEMVGMEFKGRVHTALDDARNTAELLQAFTDKDKFNKTLSVIEEAMKPSSISCSLGDLFDFSAFGIHSL